jgi:hypothetical protein
MKKFTLLNFAFLFFTLAFSQQNYCDFEGTKYVTFSQHTGKLDTLAVNPSPAGTNTTTLCAKYLRDTSTYDYIKLLTHAKMVDVTPYASNAFNAPRITMKIFSQTIGMHVKIQLGIKSIDNYPAGIHSEYEAVTTTQNSWETLTFNYIFSPAGSFAQSNDLDKMVILFNPGSNGNDSIYFDDPTGPALVNVGIEQNEAMPFRLFQNSPNPAKENTSINFQLNSAAMVSLKLYDALGSPVYVIAEQQVKAGAHSYPVDLRNLPAGIYFYILKADGITRTRKMIVEK